ncbi:MAG: DUF4838 domain-containing protein [Patescibacteria group bacterium]|nr:DUF4838 domain-containing protein [Patescibacteria group bacterium]
MRPSLLIAIFVLTPAAVPAAEPITLTTDGKSDYAIVIPAAADAVVQAAARELQEHLAKATGATLAIVPENEATADAPSILVGPCRRTKELLPDLDPESLGHDGIAVKTAGRHLILIGRPPRGTLYAVYTFLEDIVGCRWWTSKEGFIPSRPTLHVPPQDVTYAPKLRIRSAYYRDAFEGVFASRLKLNGHAHHVPAEYGGHNRFCMFVHTFFPLLPPEKYFAEHPEWYSEIDGKRRWEHAQLCLTNDQMRNELVRNAMERLRNSPESNIISISQNDWYGACQCAKCKAVEEEEGSPAGPLLRFVNAVAVDIEKEFPNVLVETLAYQYTRKPPKLVRPRENVVIRLCSIECSFVQPLAQGEQNEAFRSDIEGWSQVAGQLFVWDYVTNFSNYILPHANMRVLKPNINFFVDHNVISLFEQGDAESGVGDFVAMRTWLLSRLMWNPELDDRALMKEFLDGYYGAAGPHLLAYLDRLHDAAEQSGVYLRCFMPDTSRWLTLDDLNDAMRLYNAALDAVRDQPELLRRVRRERLPLDHVWLNRYHALRRQAKRDGKPFLGPDDPAAARDEFIALAREHGVGSFRERHSFAEREEQLARKFRPAGPPPEPCKDLPPDGWLDIQDNEFRLHKQGEWTNTASDAAASDGHAVSMPGHHREWATSIPMSADFADGGSWRVFAQVRCDATAEDGPAMTLGIYDADNRLSVAHRQLGVKDIRGEKYVTIDLGVHALKPGMYFWAAPPQRPNDVQTIYLDRIFLIRQ